jgi:putative transcriptional regulator
MSSFGDDLIQAMTEALAKAKGKGPTIIHAPIAPREGREQSQRRNNEPAAVI